VKVFVLDDCSQRHEHFRNNLDGARVVEARTANQAYRELRHDQFDVVFLDHDLEMSGQHCGSGTEVVTAIAMLVRLGMYKSEKAIHCVHSMNFEKAKDMFNALREAGLTTTRCTEAWTEERALSRLANAGEWLLPDRWTEPLSFEE
jgi:CheY-like chemotaxis protein